MRVWLYKIDFTGKTFLASFDGVPTPRKDEVFVVGGTPYPVETVEYHYGLDSYGDSTCTVEVTGRKI